MSRWSMAELLPHAGDMILIDELLDYDSEHVRVRLTVRPGTPFSRPDGSLPAWVGIELMAQAIGAYAGCRFLLAGQPIELGFLLGTRRYECNVDSFAVGTKLEVSAVRSLEDETGMGVFECHIQGPGVRVEARLNVFRPPEVARYLKEPAP